jgi:hypothetical protein
MKYRAIRVRGKWLAQRKRWLSWSTISDELTVSTPIGDDELRTHVRYYALPTLSEAIDRILRLDRRKPLTIDDVKTIDPTHYND